MNWGMLDVQKGERESACLDVLSFSLLPAKQETHFSFPTHRLPVGVWFSWGSLSSVSRTSQAKCDRIASKSFTFHPQSPPFVSFLCSLLRTPVHPNRLRLFRRVHLYVQVLPGTSRDPLPHRHRQLDVLRSRHGRRRRPRSMTPPNLHRAPKELGGYSHPRRPERHPITAIGATSVCANSGEL